MAEFIDENDSDGEIPEIDLAIKIKPYMFEPSKTDRSEEIEENYTSSDGDNETSDSDSGAMPNNTDDWCSCGSCALMPTLKECKCCKDTNIVDGKIEEAGLTCITEHEGFIVNCLNQYVLETSYYEYIQEKGPLEQNEKIHEVYRYLAYRRFVRWVYQILGKKNRRILPACVVTKIRQTFPSQQYCGFKYPI